MRTYLLAVVLAASLIQTAYAARTQSLDIGGIELHLGQKVDDALHSLSVYHVQYIGSAWVVSQKIGDHYNFLGTLAADNGAIYFINKMFDTDNAGTPAAYTKANQELHTRSGTTCATLIVQYNKDGLIHGFNTRCGHYTLSYSMPYKAADGSPVGEGVNLSLSNR